MFNDLYKLKADKACSDGNLADKAELALNLDGAAGSDPSGDQMDKFEELASILRETAARLQERVSRLVAALEKASAGLPKDAWLAQGNPADRLQQILRKESAELTGKAAAAQFGVLGRHFSVFDRACADLWGKNRPAQGDPAREDQRNTVNPASDLMAKAAAKFFGRKGWPDSPVEKAFAGISGKAWPAQRNPAEELQRKVRKGASELTKRAAAAQLGAVGCYFSSVDMTYAGLWGKAGLAQGNPAREDQRNIGKIVSDLMAKTPAKLCVRSGWPASAFAFAFAFDKAIADLPENAWVALKDPAEEARQELRRYEMELAKKLGINLHADVKFPLPGIGYAGGFTGGSRNAGAVGNTWNDLYDLLMGKAGRDQNS